MPETCRQTSVCNPDEANQWQWDPDWELRPLKKNSHRPLESVSRDESLRLVEICGNACPNAPWQRQTARGAPRSAKAPNAFSGHRCSSSAVLQPLVLAIFCSSGICEQQTAASTRAPAQHFNSLLCRFSLSAAGSRPPLTAISEGALHSVCYGGGTHTQITGALKKHGYYFAG